MLPLSIVLVGDILTGRGVALSLRSPQNALGRNRCLIAGADLAFGNLETAPKTPRSGRKPFYNPGDLAVLRDAGLDGLNLANNHTLDAGESGARQTQRELLSLGLRGAGLSLDGRPSPGQWSVGTRRVALVSATAWGPTEAGAARLQRLDLPALKRQVGDLTARGTFVVVSLHWGTEGVAASSREQRRVAHALIEAGALAVWGHHPHVAGTVESYQGRPIFASTGNFLWDTMPTPQSGLLARLQIDGATPQSARVAWRTFAVDPQVRAWKTPPTRKGETLVQAVPARFDGDGRVGWFTWTRTRRRRPVLRALEQTSEGWRVRATGLPRFVGKIEAGDLNGDGRDELVVELQQRSKLDPQSAPRLHVYDLGQMGFVALWRGSQLSRPFKEWTLAGRGDAPGCDLVALERGQNQTQWLTAYRWNGFGLRVQAQRSFAASLSDLKSGCDARGTWVTFRSFENQAPRLLRARPVSSENSGVWHLETPELLQHQVKSKTNE